MQKLLPKLHGSRNKLTKVLPILAGFCLKNKEKLKRELFRQICKQHDYRGRTRKKIPTSNTIFHLKNL